MPQDDFMGQYIPKRRVEDMESAAQFAEGIRPVQPDEHTSFPLGMPHGFAIPEMEEEVFLPSLMEDWVQTVADSMQMPSEPDLQPVSFSESCDFGHTMGMHTGAHAGGPVGGAAGMPPVASAYPALHSTYQEMLRNLMGRYVVADFLIGTSIIEQRSGTISDVGQGFFILRDPDTETYTACDLSALKFLSILPPTEVLEESHYPYQMFNRL